MLSKTSAYIAQVINNADPSVDKDIVEYELGIRLNRFLTLTLSIIVGIVTGKVLEILLAYWVLTAIRRHSGGIHFSSLTICAFFSTAVIATAALVNYSNDLANMLTYISVIIFLFYAPNIFHEQNGPVRPVLDRYMSVSIAITNLYFQWPLLSTVFIVQAFTILPFWKGGANENDETK
ncbi:hypothetical protein B2I21_07560 [Chryseobacterium mucoviscidosis]|nr:hypothetical protein B2I21_07560 [Chryseobacterium mucoviscidosis]